MLDKTYLADMGDSKPCGDEDALARIDFFSLKAYFSERNAALLESSWRSYNLGSISCLAGIVMIIRMV